MFIPTERWAAELCRKLFYNGAEGDLAINAIEAPREVSPTGSLGLLLRFREGRCVEAFLVDRPLDGDYVIEGKYADFLKIFNGELPAFAAFALGRIRLVKGSLSKLADYMPLALLILKAARESV